MKAQGLAIFLLMALCTGAGAQEAGDPPPADAAPAETQPEAQPAEAAPAESSASPDSGTESATESAAVPETSSSPDTSSTGAEPPADAAVIPSATEAAQTIDVQPLRPEQNAPVEAQPEVRQLDEVVVTAQKTVQSARRVPISVTTMSGETMQQIGVATLADVSLYIPNVRMDSDDLGSPQIFIRGFGTNSFNPSFEGSVGLVQDEIYFGRPGYFTEAMFDIDRVEVLRGPQGTLFGKNTVAGVFNIASKRPEQDFEADLRVSGGDPQDIRVEGGAGGMVNDWLGARGSILYRKKDGDLYNQFLDRREEEQDQKAGRLKLRLFPGYGIDSEMTAVTSRTEAPFWPFQIMNLADDTRSYLENFDPDIEDDPYDYRTSFDTPGWIKKGSDTVGWKTEMNMGTALGMDDFSPVLVVGWSKFFIDQLNELDVSPADIARLDSHEDHDQRSAELRFTGHADSLFGLGTGFEMVVGGFYFNSNYTLLAQVLAGQDLVSYFQTCDFQILAGLAETRDDCVPLGPTLPLGPISGTLSDGDSYRFDYDQEITSNAFFGQFTWNLTEQWAITPGVRLSREHKVVSAKGASHCQLKDNGLPPIPNVGNACIMEQLLMSMDYDNRGMERNESDVSPKLALQYFGDSINYYASYARGYKSGGFNAISLGRACDPDNTSDCHAATRDDLEYEPENARTYELGAKAKLLERTLNLNITLYKTRFENLQVLAFNGVFFDVSNAADAESKGLEADFLWLTPWAPLRLSGSLGLLDAKYLNYVDAPAPIAQGVGALQDLSGQRIAFAPKQSGTLTPMLTFPVGNLQLTVSGDIIYQGDQYTDTDLDPHTHVDAYTKYAARIILGDAEQKWSVSIGGNNLTGVRVLNQVTDATFFPGAFFAQEAAGRQLFAAVTLKL